MVRAENRRTWTVDEAKANLPEILRLAEEEWPQRIGVGKSFIVMVERLSQVEPPPRMPLGRWLVENMPLGTNLQISERGRDANREMPCADWDADVWGEK